MASDINEEPLTRSEQDHATREAAIHYAMIVAAMKEARGLDQDEKQEDAADA